MTITKTAHLSLPIVIALLLASTAVAQTPPSRTLSVSALLKHSLGDPVTGTVDIEFALYDAAIGGVPLWSESHVGVPLAEGGRFSVRLGTFTPITAALFSTPDRWIGLNVNSDGEMVPRMPLSAMPYSYNAASLDGVPAADHATEAELSDMDPATSPVHWQDLTSVPAGFLDGTDDVDDADNDPTNELQSWGTLPGIPAGFADGTDDVADADADPTNELQSWATLPGIPAGFTDGTDDVVDADSDPTNELNTSVLLLGTNLQISDAGGTLNASLASLVDDADADPTNELQSWATLPGIPAGFTDGTDDVVDADSDPTNELNTSVLLLGTNLQISDAGGTLNASLASLVDDADADPTNELQSWATLPGIPAGFTDGTDDVVDADSDPTNELNTSVLLLGTNLQISDAGGTLNASLASLVDDADADPTNELQSWATLPGIPAGFTDGTDDVVDADSSTANELNSSLVLVGTSLQLSDGGGTLMADLASIAGGALPALDAVIWVATNGTGAGPGNIDSPFDTPQAGYDAATALGPGVHAAVVIASGRYQSGFVWEDLDMHSGQVHVFGLGTPRIGTLMVSSRSTLTMGLPFNATQRVEGIGALKLDVTTSGGQVKFRSCRFDGLTGFVDGSDVEFHDCFFRQQAQNTALRVGDTAAIQNIGFYQCSIVGGGAGSPALLVDGSDRGLSGLEVVGCDIVNGQHAGPAVQTGTTSVPPGAALHLYSRNLIIGATAGSGTFAFDDFRGPGTPTYVFTHNTVRGDVGNSTLGGPAAVYFSNNTVYGTINNAGGTVGWIQAGAPILDGAGNAEVGGPPPNLPSVWQD